MIKISLDKITPCVPDAFYENNGAVVTFSGIMRKDDGVKVMTLEHYPMMTEKQLRVAVDDAKKDYGITHALVQHRIGEITPGEMIVFVAVASPHRKESYAASMAIMNALKSTVPFWKHEVLADKPARWVPESKVQNTKVKQVVACALIDSDGRVLLGKRPMDKPMGGLWELPGGKIEAGETPEQAIIRELDEELTIKTEQSCLAPLTFTSHNYEAFHLVLLLYVCRIWQGTPTPQAHDALKWVDVRDLKDYPLPPANDPLVAHLRDFL